MSSITTLVGIYKIHNIVTGDFYIGSSVNIEARLSVHKSLLIRNVHYNPHLQRAWNKYGESSFILQTLILCNKSQTKVYEQLLIGKLKPPYNISKNATGGDGSAFTTESRIKAGISRRGVPKPESYSEKLSKRMVGNTVWLGRKRSEETQRKMHEILLGNKNSLGSKHTDEWKDNMSKKMKGRIFSEETKKKMSESRKAYFARVRAEKEGRNNE